MDLVIYANPKALRRCAMHACSLDPNTKREKSDARRTLTTVAQTTGHGWRDKTRPLPGPRVRIRRPAHVTRASGGGVHATALRRSPATHHRAAQHERT